MFVIKDRNDIKIFILYLMRHIGYPLDFDSINDIVLQDGFVGSFDFTECFAELLETGNIEEQTDKEGNENYIITEQGIAVCDTLDSSLLNVIKEKSLKSAVRLLSFKKRGTKIKFDFENLPNDRYLCHCSIIEKDEEIMKISLVLESRYQLEKIRANFTSKPEIVYRGILSVITGEINYLID